VKPLDGLNLPARCGRISQVAADPAISLEVCEISGRPHPFVNIGEDPDATKSERDR